MGCGVWGLGLGLGGWGQGFIHRHDEEVGVVKVETRPQHTTMGMAQHKGKHFHPGVELRANLKSTSNRC